MGSRLYETLWVDLRGLQTWAISAPKVVRLLVPAVFERRGWKEREGRVVYSILSPFAIYHSKAIINWQVERDSPHYIGRQLADMRKGDIVCSSALAFKYRDCIPCGLFPLWRGCCIVMIKGHHAYGTKSLPTVFFIASQLYFRTC